jgi:putative membrane protein
MKNNTQNSRRQFLSHSLKGSLALVGGLSAAGVLLESFSLAPDPKSELEFRTQLAPLGNLSLTTSQLALTKATNPKVKMFATFEAEEQKTMAKILQEMKTPTPPIDAKGQAVINNLKTLTGAAFDKAFMQAQVDTHEQLQALTAAYVANAEGKTALPEMHTRHVASVALATIKEHTERGKMLLGELA